MRSICELVLGKAVYIKSSFLQESYVSQYNNTWINSHWLVTGNPVAFRYKHKHCQLRNMTYQKLNLWQWHILKRQRSYNLTVTNIILTVQRSPNTLLFGIRSADFRTFKHLRWKSYQWTEDEACIFRLHNIVFHSPFNGGNALGTPFFNEKHAVCLKWRQVEAPAGYPTS